MGPQYFTFPPLRPILSGASADSCAGDGCQSHNTLLLRYIRDAPCAGVTSRTVGCAMSTQGGVKEMRVCENENLMRREGSD